MGQMTFGQFFKERRIATGLTLRAFCREHHFDAGNISKLERGVFPPPDSEEKLEEYARALGLRSGGTDWITFFDLAAAERGRLPRDLQDEELLGRLPVLFRTLRGAKIDETNLDELIERIRKA
jgi:transcriptional regulator with XRE-family HTH domain